MGHRLTERIGTFGPKAYPTIFEVNESIETTQSPIESPFDENKTKPLTLPVGTKAIVAKPIRIEVCQEKTVNDYLLWQHCEFFKTFSRGTPLGLILRAIRTGKDLPPTHPLVLQKMQPSGTKRTTRKQIKDMLPDQAGEITLVAAHPCLPVVAFATSNSKVFLHDERNEHRRFASFHLEPAKVFGHTPKTTALCFSKHNQLAIGLDNELGQVDLWTLDLEATATEWYRELLETEEEEKTLPRATCNSILLPPSITDLKKNYVPVPVSGAVKHIAFSHSLPVMAVSTNESGSGVFLYDIFSQGIPIRILSHISVFGKLKPDYCTSLAWAPSGSPPIDADGKSKFTKSQYQQLTNMGNTLLVGTKFGNIHLFKASECGGYLSFSKAGVFSSMPDIWKFSQNFGETPVSVRGEVTNIVVLPKQLEYVEGKDGAYTRSQTCLVTFAKFEGIVSLRFSPVVVEQQEGLAYDPWIFCIVCMCNIMLFFLYICQSIYDTFNPISITWLLYEPPRDIQMEVEGLIETPFVTDMVCDGIPATSETRRLPKREGSSIYWPLESAFDARQWEFLTKPGIVKQGGLMSKLKKVGFEDSIVIETPAMRQWKSNNPYKKEDFNIKPSSDFKNEHYKNRFAFGGYIDSMAIDSSGRRLLVSFMRDPASYFKPSAKLPENCNVFLFKLQQTTLTEENNVDVPPRKRSASGIEDSRTRYPRPFSMTYKYHNPAVLETPRKFFMDLRENLKTPRKTPFETRLPPPSTAPRKASYSASPVEKIITALVPLGATTTDPAAIALCDPQQKSAARELMSPPSPWNPNPAPPFSSLFRDQHNNNMMRKATSHVTRTSKVFFVHGNERLPWDSQLGCYVICCYGDSTLWKDQDGRFRGNCVVRLPVGGDYPTNPYSEAMQFRLERIFA